MYTFEPLSESNLVSLGEDGINWVTDPELKAIVGLRDFRPFEIQEQFEYFILELRDTLKKFYSMTSVEHMAWRVHDRSYDFAEHLLGEQDCIGFKRRTAGSPNLAFLKQNSLITTMIATGLMPATDAHKNPRQNAPTGGISTATQGLSLDTQRRLLAEVFKNLGYDLDEIVRINQTCSIDIKSVRTILEESVTPTAALTQLAAALWKFDHQEKVSAPGGQGAGRHYGVAWFSLFLCRNGLIALPRLENPEYLFSGLHFPLLWTMFVPEHGRKLARHIVEENTTKWTYTLDVFRQLIINTNFFSARALTFDHLLHLKREFGANVMNGLQEGLNEKNSFALNGIFKCYLRFHGKSVEEVQSISKYFGGFRRANKDHSYAAFAWVDDPKLHKLAVYRKLIGEPPKEFSPTVRSWARELRAILPDFRVRVPKQKIKNLDYWLMYLARLGDDAPAFWTDIDRDLHINHFGNDTHLTFVGFLAQLELVNRQSIIGDLAQAWQLAAIKHAFAGRQTPPIDIRLDNIRPEARRTGRTRRSAIPEDIFNIVRRENTANDFAFARSQVVVAGPIKGRAIYDRLVRNPDTGRNELVFWPAHAICLDLILSMGLRSSSALWMDSGEGDEMWVDLDTVEAYSNPLSSSTPGRAAGLIEIMQLGRSIEDRVLGMHVHVNKTGPFSVAWIDPESARHWVRMRDWQVRWNPKRIPTSASRSALDLEYAGAGLVPEVFPVFRDPLSNNGHPPTRSALNAYWTALLAHCEPIVRRELGRDEPTLVQGKARWDIHSIRVTKISTLIDNNVPPEIAADLVGHLCVATTWHYKATNIKKAHETLSAAYEIQRLRALEQLQNLAESEFTGTDEEFDAKLESALDGVVRFRNDNMGSELFREARRGGQYEVYAHGVCPGGHCGEGGELVRNTYGGVFRPRACSRCRFRITGAPFLAGLVNRLNSLMVEMKSSLDTEGQLNTDIENLEDQGVQASGKTIILRGLIQRERELRDNLWAEWCAELRTVRMAENQAVQSKSGQEIQLWTGLKPAQLHAQVETVHQLQLFNRVLADSTAMLGGKLEIPPGLPERRDAMLLDLAQRNNVAEYFYKLDPTLRREALGKFGDILLQHVEAEDDVQSLLEGSTSLFDIPSLSQDLRELLPVKPRSETLLEQTLSK